ncbi:unnamed protein product, partial [Chrysoparadoxa australica]
MQANMALIAHYEQVDPTVIPLPPPILLGASGFYGHIEMQWHVTAETRAMCDEVVALITADAGGPLVFQSGVVVSTNQKSARAKVPAGAATYSVQLFCYSTARDEVTAGSTVLQVT